MMLKTGVKLAGLQPQIVLALMAAQKIWDEMNDPLTVTSVNDSGHSHQSLHYAGAAVDVRIRGVSDPHLKAAQLRDALTPDFDVVLESDHIHIEYQPRRI